MSTRTVRVWNHQTNTVSLWEYEDSVLTADPPPVNVHLEDIQQARKDAGLPDYVMSPPERVF